MRPPARTVVQVAVAPGWFHLGLCDEAAAVPIVRTAVLSALRSHETRGVLSERCPECGAGKLSMGGHLKPRGPKLAVRAHAASERSRRIGDARSADRLNGVTKPASPSDDG
jgi:hypothetical protein